MLFRSSRLKDFFKVRSLSAVARAISVAPSVLSKVQRHELAVSSHLLMKVHEVTSIPVRELRAWMGDDRPLYKVIKGKRSR